MRRIVASEFKELKKQVEDTAARQVHSEDKFKCRIAELENEVNRLNFEIKQLKARLDGHLSGLQEKVEDRDSERVEIEATPALEKELKERRPEMEEVPVTLRGKPKKMDLGGTDVATIERLVATIQYTLQGQSYARLRRPYLLWEVAQRVKLDLWWEQWENDNRKREEAIKARKEAAELRCKHEERFKE